MKQDIFYKKDKKKKLNLSLDDFGIDYESLFLYTSISRGLNFYRRIRLINMRIVASYNYNKRAVKRKTSFSPSCLLIKMWFHQILNNNAILSRIPCRKEILYFGIHLKYGINIF